MKNTPLFDLKKNVVLIESAWEVCNQVGGIYTVIRSKVLQASKTFKSNYCVTGPFIEKANSEFQRDKNKSKDIFYLAVQELMQEYGWKIYIGRWLISGEPRAVLFDISSFNENKLAISYKDSPIDFSKAHTLFKEALIFSEMTRVFIEKVASFALNKDQIVLAHFHEWMSSGALYKIPKNKNIKTIFTTHATLLGRYLAMNDPLFYDKLPFYDTLKEAHYFNIYNEYTVEKISAQKADIFSTVSQTTARECEFLLERKPENILPNGLNIQRFLARHESQNLHEKYKNVINKFVINHFFPYYSFDLDKTLYFFTSGRYEYKNKGFDLTLKALYMLNERLKKAKSNVTIVFFFITKAPYSSLNPEVLEINGLTQEIEKTSNRILESTKEKFLRTITEEKNTDTLPSFDTMINDFDRLKLKRLLRSWKRKGLPKVITHNLIDDQNDPILNFIREYKFFNKKEDPVKIVYSADFINATNPLWGIDYQEFLRGCHLGVFPSYYEPWGYTPLECIASGIPTITSDLSGFGEYSKTMARRVDGLTNILRYQKTEAYSLEMLTKALWQTSQLDRNERISQRNIVEAHADIFDWKYLYENYLEAYLELTKSIKI